MVSRSRLDRKAEIKTFIIDWPVLVFLGLLFGGFAPRARWWRSRAFVLGGVTAAVFTATAMLSYAIAPDWMWMYFIDPDKVEWSVPLIPLGYLFVFALAFAAGVALKEAGSRAPWIAAVLALGMEVAVVGITWDRYHLVGTAAQWSAGTANELFTASPSGDAKTIGLFGPVFAAILIACFVLTMRNARESAAGR